jgi:phosphatidylserine/phosphatidylglycerophosphate/cardiolipin synthase-like enzyme
MEPSASEIPSARVGDATDGGGGLEPLSARAAIVPNDSSASKPRSARASRHLARNSIALAAALTLAAPKRAGAQIPRDTIAPPRITSMGQPPLWQPYTSVVGTFGRNNDAIGGLALGLFRPIGSPITGVFGFSGEAYVLASDSMAIGGARLLGVTRAINLGYGIDWDARENNFAFMLSVNTAVRRGGIFGHGTTLRVDWIPARGNGLDVGITVPLGQRYAGRTRPRRTGVSLRDVAPAPAGEPRADYSRAKTTPLPPSADTALARVREAAGLIAAYSNFFDEKHEADIRKDVEKFSARAHAIHESMVRVSADYPGGRTFPAAERVYAASLQSAFASAVRDTTLGAIVARRARAGLLTHLLIPYDALFGRVKEEDDDLSPLLDVTRADFRAWLADSSAVPSDGRMAAVKVHDVWLAVVAQVHERIRSHWSDDSRRVWLPMQLGLTPEQHDDQAEVDALIARVVGRPFTRGNEVTYLHEDRTQIEIARSLLAARDYHVLWVHDYAGQRASRAVDRIGFAQTANVYFPALTQAVQRFDSTGHLTTFLIFLDQNFYEPAAGRLWMTILGDPLGAKIHLPSGNDSLEAVLRARQQALRDAVAQSRSLQALAARHGGEEWLRRTIKVHVNITQPSDFTFRSHRIIAGVPLLPDNLMRDHRKIAFYDVTETEPFRGGMVLSGVGIGEHYATPTWEDRGILVRGPAVLEVRAAARRLLKLNDFADDEIPPPLRETALCRNCGRAAGATDGDNVASSEVGRALQVHNEPGFGRKQASIAKAMLYTLAPRGSVIIAPDGLWLDSNWAGMLAGAALRGCRVFVVGPALANAPAPGFPQMSRTQEVFLRLLQMRHEFMQEIHRDGGELRVGLYTATNDVNDIAQQAREARAGIDRYPWLRDLVPLAPSVLAVLDSAPAVLERAGYHPFVLGKDEKPRLPQLHRKTQFVADSAALARLAARPEWREVMIQTLIARAAQAQRGTKTGLYDDTVTTAGSAAVGRLLQAYDASRPAADSARLTFYFTVGTQNQDPRGMLLDGEALFVLSGMSAAVGLIDLYSLMARSTWIETEAELDRLLPPYKTWQRRLGRFARLVL